MLLQQGHGSGIHPGEYIRISIQRDMDVGVSEPGLQHQRRDPCLDASCRECMSERVLPHGLYTGLLTHTPEEAFHL